MPTYQPIHNLTYQFWPDKSLLLQEALERYELGDYRDFQTQAGIEANHPCYVFWTEPKMETPVLSQFEENFKAAYPNLGRFLIHYFYILPFEIDWHVDNGISKWITGWEWKCAINVILTGTDQGSEFEHYGRVEYQHAVFNTSHKHRVVDHVSTGNMRVHARIAFRDYNYGQVIQAIKRADKHR